MTSSGESGEVRENFPTCHVSNSFKIVNMPRHRIWGEHIFDLVTYSKPILSFFLAREASFNLGQ